MPFAPEGVLSPDLAPPAPSLPASLEAEGGEAPPPPSLNVPGEPPPHGEPFTGEVVGDVFMEERIGGDETLVSSCEV